MFSIFSRLNGSDLEMSGDDAKPEILIILQKVLRSSRLLARSPAATKTSSHIPSYYCSQSAYANSHPALVHLFLLFLLSWLFMENRSKVQEIFEKA